MSCSAKICRATRRFKGYFMLKIYPNDLDTMNGSDGYNAAVGRNFCGLVLKKTEHSQRATRTHLFDRLIPGRFSRLHAVTDRIRDLRTLVPDPGTGVLDQFVELAFAN